MEKNNKNNNIKRLEPDIYGDEVQHLTDSEGNKIKVTIQNTLLKKGEIENEIIINQSKLDHIKYCSSIGLGIPDMSKIVDIDVKVLEKLSRTCKKVKDAIEKGKAMALKGVKNTALTLALKGHPAFTLAYLDRHDPVRIEESPKVLSAFDKYTKIENMTEEETLEALKKYNKIMEKTDLEKRSAGIESRKNYLENILENDD